MTHAEFDSIVRDVAVAVLPKAPKGTLNEFLFTLKEELESNGFEFEGGDDENDVRDDDDEGEE